MREERGWESLILLEKGSEEGVDRNGLFQKEKNWTGEGVDFSNGTDHFYIESWDSQQTFFAE